MFRGSTAAAIPSGVGGCQVWARREGSAGEVECTVQTRHWAQGLWWPVSAAPWTDAASCPWSPAACRRQLSWPSSAGPSVSLHPGWCKRGWSNCPHSQTVTQQRARGRERNVERSLCMPCTVSVTVATRTNVREGTGGSRDLWVRGPRLPYCRVDRANSTVGLSSSPRYRGGAKQAGQFTHFAAASAENRRSVPLAAMRTPRGLATPAANRGVGPGPCTGPWASGLRRVGGWVSVSPTS